MAKRKKKRKLKAGIKGLIVLLAVFDSVLLFLLLTSREEKYVDRSQEAIGVAMLEKGYHKKTSTTYTLTTQSGGAISEDELMHEGNVNRIVQEYNEDARVILETSYRGDTCIGVKEYTYKDNVLERMDIKDGEGNLVQYSLPSYDNQTKKTSWMLYDAKDRVIGLSEIYNEKDLLEESYVFDLEGEILYNHLYTYDTKDRLIKMETKLNDIALSEQTFTYGKSGRTNESIYQANDGTYRKDNYQYDEAGVLKKVIQYDQHNHELMSNTYTYDVDGFLVKDTSIKANKYIQVILYKYE